MRMLADTVRATAEEPVTIDEAEESLRRIDALVSKGTRGPIVSMPLPERVLSCMAEIGDLSREIHLALADGTVDAGERSRILTELGHARAELDRLERDLG